VLRPLDDFSHGKRNGLTCLLPVLRPLDNLASWKRHILEADKRDTRIAASATCDPVQIQAHPEPR